jgi:hypothetical protein
VTVKLVNLTSVSEKIATSVADLVEQWAISNVNPNVDSVIIVTQFSSRVRKPIYQKTAEEFKQGGKKELIDLLSQTVDTAFGPQVQLADDINQPWKSWEHNTGRD